MSLRVTYLLLLAVLVLFVYGLWQAIQGRIQQSEAARRVRLARGQPAGPPLRAAMDARLRRTGLGRVLDARLGVAGIGLGPSEALLTVLGAAAGAYVIVSVLLGPLFAVAAAAAAVFACARYATYRQARRREEFVAQLPELARVVSNASAAGLALPRAVELAATELAQPASDVMRRVSEELRVGQPVDRALENLHGRMPSREVGVLVSTLIIQQRAGGDTVAALREMAGTLEARKDLRREVRTTMAGAIATGWVVGGLAVGSLLLLNLINPGVLQQMMRTGLGRVALVLGLGLFTTGFLLIRRTTRVET